jgi:hypothetical protein
MHNCVTNGATVTEKRFRAGSPWTQLQVGQDCAFFFLQQLKVRERKMGKRKRECLSVYLPLLPIGLEAVNMHRCFKVATAFTEKERNLHISVDTSSIPKQLCIPITHSRDTFAFWRKGILHINIQRFVIPNASIDAKNDDNHLHLCPFD